MGEQNLRNFTINFGPQHPAAHGVLRLVLELRAGGVEVGVLLEDLCRLGDAADAHEEVREAEQVVLLPDVVRVPVALGAFEPQPQEGVGHLQGRVHAGGGTALPVQIERLAFAVQLQIRPAG